MERDGLATRRGDYAVTLLENYDPNTYHFTLEGPATSAPRASILGYFLKEKIEWRSVRIKMTVGGESCPDWDHVNLILTAVQDLVTMNDGLISDTVIQALRENLEIVEYKTFQGPSRSAR
jgi:hypothetical protein